MSYFDPHRFGVSTNLLDNPGDVVATIDHLSARFPIVELELEDDARSVLRGGPPAWEAIVEQLVTLRQERGFVLSVHAPYVGPECDLASEDADVRRASAQLLTRSIRFAADIGATRLTYHPGYLARQPLRRLLENLMRSLDDLVPGAHASGVTLCLENMGADRPKYIVLSPADHVELCRKTGSRLTFDVVHQASLGAVEPGLFETLHTLLPYVDNVHLGDAVPPKHVHLPLHEGALPIERVLTCLAQEGYQGNVIVEETGGGYPGQEFVEHAWSQRAAMLVPAASASVT